MKFDYEVLIIGGGPAGLTAAMTLGRINRSAILCDDNHPRNAPSSHVNNFPTRDGIHPEEWRKHARKDLEKYKTIQLLSGSVETVEKINDGFRARISSGKIISIKKVILAYGVKDRLLPVPGFNELWGKAIFHCPFCHGFEIRGSEIGIIINHEMAFHSLPMIHSLSSNLVVFIDQKVKLTEDQRSLLASKKATVIEEKIEKLIYEGEVLRAVALSDGREIARQYLFFAGSLPFELKSKIGETLGCEKNQFGLYQVKERGETTVPGVFACGDNMSMAHSVLIASASGVMAGSGVIFELLNHH